MGVETALSEASSTCYCCDTIHFPFCHNLSVNSTARTHPSCADQRNIRANSHSQGGIFAEKNLSAMYCRVADVMNPEKQVVSLTAGEEEAAVNHPQKHDRHVSIVATATHDFSSHVISAGFVCPLEMKMSDTVSSGSTLSNPLHPTDVLCKYLLHLTTAKCRL